jgi:hypothetical protein
VGIDKPYQVMSNLGWGQDANIPTIFVENLLFLKKKGS